MPDWLKPVTRDADVQAMAEAWQKDYEQQVAQSGDELHKFRQSLPAIFNAGKSIVAQGRPAEQILSTIVKEKIDLAVVGSRGRGTVERLLIGSTSSQIISESPCSVLIVR
jgi:nucleotide-binding universal stress UspA family protein